MFNKELIKKSRDVLKILKRRNIKLVTAESCTGGLVAALFTETPGSSEVFERGYVTYSNDAKIELLTVPTFFIEDYGAVSREVAVAMAEGALLMSKADISVSITGIAGPDGGSDEKPVGTVFIGSASKFTSSTSRQFLFSGNRDAVRMSSVNAALDMIFECASLVVT